METLETRLNEVARTYATDPKYTRLAATIAAQANVAQAITAALAGVPTQATA